jgi:hypothetical protein
MNTALVLNALSLSLLGYWFYNKKSQELYPKQNIDDKYPLTELILGNRKYQNSRKKQKTAVIVYGDVDVKEIFQTDVYVIRYREPFDYEETTYVDISTEIEYCYQILGIKTFIFLGHTHNPKLLKSVVFEDTYIKDRIKDVIKNESKKILVLTNELFNETLKENIKNKNVKLYYAILEASGNVTIYHYIF